METWSPNHWTARGFSTGYFLKEEWMIHIYIKIVTYTIIPTQLLSTGHGSLMWVRKEGKEWEAITLYCWLFRRRQWHPTPVLLPGKSHERRSLVDCSPWGCEESDMTEWLPFYFSLMHWRRKWQPTPVFLPGESQGRGSLVGCHLWGHTESDTIEAT